MSGEQDTVGTNQERPYRNEEWLYQRYEEEERTLKEVAELCDASESTLCRWVKKFGFNERKKEYDLSDVEIPDSQPWRNRELMRTLYEDKNMSTTEISHEFDCSSATITNWLHDHGIETRDMSEANQASRGTLNRATFHTKKSGYEVCQSVEKMLRLHRLIAVAKFGIEPVKGMHVHHKNNIPWDNRPENLELITNSEHQKKHRKLGWLERLAVVEMYRSGASSYKIAPTFDVSPNTVIKNIRDFDRELVRDHGGAV